MYGAPSTIGRLWYCQSAAVCGNFIGGAFFIGMVAHLTNHWKSPIFTTKEPGTGLAHDVESTRHHGEKEETPIPTRESNDSGCDVDQSASACGPTADCEPTFPRSGTAGTDDTVHPEEQIDNVGTRHHASIFRSTRSGDDIV
jgi:hypothetical protein